MMIQYTYIVYIPYMLLLYLSDEDIHTSMNYTSKYDNRRHKTKTKKRSYEHTWTMVNNGVTYDHIVPIAVHSAERQDLGPT